VALDPHISAKLRSIDESLALVTKVGDQAVEVVNLAAFFRRGQFVPNRLSSFRCHTRFDFRLGGASIPWERKKPPCPNSAWLR
jgi:hypothetical protein